MTPVLHLGVQFLMETLVGVSHLGESRTSWRSYVSNFIKIGHQKPHQDDPCTPSWSWNFEFLKSDYIWPSFLCWSLGGHGCSWEESRTSWMIQDGSWDHVDSARLLNFWNQTIFDHIFHVGVLEDMDIPERSQERHAWFRMVPEIM